MSALKILVVEDSEIASDILTQALESDGKLQVVGVARNGQEALNLIPSLSPDLITMDVYMPIMDGFETVERIMADYPTPILVITSSSLKEDIRLSMRMLEAGALDVIEKPLLSNEAQWVARQRELITRVKMLAGVKVITHLRGRRNQAKAETQPLKSEATPNFTPAPPDPRVLKPLPPSSLSTRKNLPILPEKNHPLLPNSAILPANSSSFAKTEALFPLSHQMNNRPEVIKAAFPDNPFYQVVALASSTGGPTALLRILQILPPNLPCGLLLVQHISEGFTQGLVDWLQRETALKIKVAQNGERVTPGQVLVAPDGRDLLINSNGQIVTSKDSKEGDHQVRPCADVLMRSVAHFYRARSIGLVLTGMGSDGAKGLLEMAYSGAYTLAQDEATSLIYGMPKAATDNGAAHEVIALGRIATRLVELLQYSSTNSPFSQGGRRR